MSFPTTMNKCEFILLWNAKYVGEVYIGQGFYTFDNNKEIYKINFTESTPKEIKDKATKIYIDKSEPLSNSFTVYIIKNFDRVLYSRIFELHDEVESCLKFPEQCYKKIEDPALKKLIKEKIKEWANSKELFGEGMTKKLLKELDEKLEVIDKGR